MIILHSRAWIPLFKLKTFRKISGGHWLHVTKNKVKYWEQYPRRVDIPNHKPKLKKQMGLDNVHEQEYFGDEFIDCRWVGSVGGVVDYIWKSMRGKTK